VNTYVHPAALSGSVQVDEFRDDLKERISLSVSAARQNFPLTVYRTRQGIGRRIDFPEYECIDN